MEKSNIKQKIEALMETIIPGLPKLDEHTILDEIGFDVFSRGLLAYELENSFAITLPKNIEDQWETFGDIVASVTHCQH